MKYVVIDTEENFNKGSIVLYQLTEVLQFSESNRIVQYRIVIEFVMKLGNCVKKSINL